MPSLRVDISYDERFDAVRVDLWHDGDTKIFKKLYPLHDLKRLKYPVTELIKDVEQLVRSIHGDGR